MTLHFGQSVSHGLHMPILSRKKIHIQSTARIVWHIAPRDRWCHLHPRVRRVPARFVDNDLFKWEKGEKIHKTSSLSKYGTFTAVENDENEALLRAVFSHCYIALREKTWEKICPPCNSILLFFSCHPASFPKMYLCHRFWVYTETTSLQADLLSLFFHRARLFSLAV